MLPDPATLRIVNHPAPILRQKARPIAAVNDEIRAIAQRMIDLMHEAGGIGLAAPQVGLDLRLFICDVPPYEDQPPADDTPAPSNDAPNTDPDLLEFTEGPIVYINPKLTAFSRDLVPHEEGCLSLPKIRGTVRRPSIVTITATNLEGKPFTQTTGELLARCIQHENDHLDGILILDKMTQPDRLRNRSLIKELEAATPAAAPPRKNSGARR